MWGRRRLWTKKNVEPRCKKELGEAVNETVAKERRSQEQKLKLWKDRPRLTKEEIPDEAFQILQKQHDVVEDNS